MPVKCVRSDTPVGMYIASTASGVLAPLTQLGYSDVLSRHMTHKHGAYPPLMGRPRKLSR